MKTKTIEEIVMECGFEPAPGLIVPGAGGGLGTGKFNANKGVPTSPMSPSKNGRVARVRERGAGVAGESRDPVYMVGTLGTLGTSNVGAGSSVPVLSPTIQKFGDARGRVNRAAAEAGVAPALVASIDDVDLTALLDACAAAEGEHVGRGHELVRQYLLMLATAAVMRRGERPDDFDTAARCKRCGPVWLPSSQVRLLHVVNGWPACLGCPWCFVRAEVRQCVACPVAPDSVPGY